MAPAEPRAPRTGGAPLAACGAAIAAALLYTVACPPYGVDAAAWLVPAVLLVPCRGLTPVRAGACGVLFALVLGVGVTSWAFTASLAYFDFHRVAAGAFVVVVWLLYGGIPFGVLLAVYAALGPRLPAAARAPVAAWAWVVMEWLRTTLLTGMPWELLGHTQFRRLWLIQVADVGGAAAVSFVIALASVAVGEVARDALATRPVPWTAGRRLAPAAAVLALVLAYGAASEPRWSAPDASPSATLALVQGNVPNAYRWQRTHMERTLASYVALTESTRAARPDLVVWPENAVDFYLEREPLLRASLARAAALAPAGLLVGSPRLASDGEARNSAQLLDARGVVRARYDKQHLVPFAEASLLPTRTAAAAAEPVYGAGPRADPVVTAVGRLGTTICYEVVFPGLVRDLVRRGADVLVNLANDSWLDAGDGAALEQHFSMAVFRAIETRRDLVRVASAGPSGIIDAAGHVVAHLPRGVAAATVGRVRRRDGLTPYVRFGDAWIAALGVGLAAATWRTRRGGTA